MAAENNHTLMSSNAFPKLSDRPLAKRWRTEETHSILSTPKESFLRFHVIHCTDPQKTVRTLSPFIVAKCLADTIGPGYKATKMISGDLLLEVRDSAQYRKLSNLVAFGAVPITVTPHRSMNTVRGVISDDDLLNLSEEELLEGWKEQNVTQVQRIKIKRENKEIPTKFLIITFASTVLPESLETGYTKTRTRPYIPNPRRCFKCQRFGHGSQSCRGRLTCAKCGNHEHSSDICDSPLHCPNCEGEHAAYSRACPTWKKEKDIITLKYKENISFREARRRCSPFHGTFYADAARRGAAPQRPSPQAQLARSELSALAPAPVVEAVTSAPPTPQESPATLGSLAPTQPPARACATRTEHAGSSRPVTVGAARAASPSPAPAGAVDEQRSLDPKTVPSTSGLVGSKISSTVARLSRETSRSLERSSGASQEAMDTTPILTAHQAPKERRASLDRSKKDKTRVTGPRKGPVI